MPAFRIVKKFAVPTREHNDKRTIKNTLFSQAFCTSPCVKFWWEVAMYGIFIAYQSFVILARVGKEDEYNCQLNTEKIILIIWFGMLLIDEFIQV